MAYQSLNSSNVTATCYKKSYSATSFSLTGTENFTFLNSNTRLSIGDDSSNHYIYVTKITFSLPSTATDIKLQLLKGYYSGGGGIGVYHSTTNYTQDNMLGTNGLISKNDQNGHSLNYTASGTLNIPTSSGQYYSPCDVFTLSKSFPAGTNYLYLYSFSIYAPLYGGTTTDGTAISSYLSYNPASGGGDSGGGDSGGGDSGGGDSGGGDSGGGSSFSGNIKKYEKITATDISNLKTAIINIYHNRKYLKEAGLKRITSDSSGFGNTAISTNNQINQNFYYILKSILQLNSFSGVAQNNQYDIIFKNGVTSDLLTAITTASTKWETEDPKDKDHKPISCRGGCVGFCYSNCSGECTYACVTGSDGGTSGSGSSLEGGTDHDDNCKTSCDTACYNTCKEVCYTECNNGCKDTCTGNCSRDCTTGCYTQCQGMTDIT